MTTKQFVTISQSQPTCGPGMYSVVTPGVTIQLESWTHWQAQDDKIVVKDNTGSFTPNITVTAPALGAIDGNPSVTLNNPREVLIFRPLTGGLFWSVT